MGQILAKKMIVDLSSTTVRPQTWAKSNDSSLCVLFAGSPSWDTEVDLGLVSQSCDLVYERLIDLQFSQLTESKFAILIRNLFAECDEQFNLEFFLSAGVVIRNNCSVFAATVGYVESWFIKDFRLTKLTSPTTLTLPIPSRGKVLLSALGLGSFRGEFSQASFSDCTVPPIFLLADGSVPLTADSSNLLPFLANASVPTEFTASLTNCATMCVL